MVNEITAYRCPICYQIYKVRENARDCFAMHSDSLDVETIEAFECKYCLSIYENKKDAEYCEN